MEFDEFKKKLLKLSEPRHHKIKNSWGVYDAYKFYRKNKPKDKKYILTESEYFHIIRGINQLLIKGLLEGQDIILPYKMGMIEIRKRKYSNLGMESYRHLPVDWDSTIKLWYNDPEALKAKTLIRRCDYKDYFKIMYNKTNATYKNQWWYDIAFNKELKRDLKVSINNGLDAFHRISIW